MTAIEALTPKRYADGKRFSFESGINGRAPGWRPDRETRRKLGGRYKRSFVFKMQFGPGNGYVRWNEDRTKVLVKGRILFIGWRSGSRQHKRDHGIRANSGLTNLAWFTPLEVGLRGCYSIYLSH